MRRFAFFASLVVTVASLAGCTTRLDAPEARLDAAGSAGPGVGTLPSGRTIHLRATVIDVEQEVVPNFTANLWAFCFGAADPQDAVSAAAVEARAPLPGDHVPTAEGLSCGVPGPTLRVRQGDRVIVDLDNSHVHPHSIHWHGQLVPWHMDGAPGVSQDSVVTGSNFTYDFIAKKAGTLWYHCHVDGQEHIMKGLYGAFIVEPQDTTNEPKDIGREYVWVLGTANFAELMQIVPGTLGQHAGHLPTCMSGTQGCEQPPSAAGSPDLFFINGHSYPLTMEQEGTLLKIKPGERIRLRIVNAGETVETIHPHGHDMLVTHRDGNVLPLGLQYYMDTLDIAPAQRIDVVITGDNPGPWMVHTHVASHETSCHKSGGGMHSMLVYEGFEDRMHSFKTGLPATCDRTTTPSASALVARVIGVAAPQAAAPGGPPEAQGAEALQLALAHAAHH